VKDVPTTNLNITEFVSIHAQSELSLPTDIVPEDVIQTVTSWTTNVMPPAQSDMLSEPMLLVFLNAQLVTSLMVKFVNLSHKTVHQVNSTMLNLVFVLLVLTHVLNVNTLQTIVQSAHQDLLSLQASVLNPTAVELENSEIHQDHV
jgi:hypothetical protein